MAEAGEYQQRRCHLVSEPRERETERERERERQVSTSSAFAGESWNLQEIDLDEVARTFQEPDTREDNIRPRDLKNDEAAQHLLKARCLVVVAVVCITSTCTVNGGHWV